MPNNQKTTPLSCPECAALLQDKERLDWLEYNTDKIISKVNWPFMEGVEFREAIDAARGADSGALRAKPEPEGGAE